MLRLFVADVAAAAADDDGDDDDDDDAIEFIVISVINSDDVDRLRAGARSAALHHKRPPRGETLVLVIRVCLDAVERASSPTCQGRRHLRAGDTLRQRRWAEGVNVWRCKAANTRPTRTTRGAWRKRR